MNRKYIVICSFFVAFFVLSLLCYGRFLYAKKKEKKKSDRVQRAYYLDRDIDKALRRMALEEGKNLTESINDALRKGLVEYL